MAETVAAVEKQAIRWPLTRWDVAGAFGDIGILFPIAIALISLNHLNPTTVFLTAGLAYVLAGAYFRIPISVQPFKAVAAIALALQLPPSAIGSAGLLMGILLAFIGLTNLVTPLAKLFTLPVVRGIQLGLGLILVREGIRLALGAKSAPLMVTGVAVSSWEIAVVGAALLVLLRRSDRFPPALVLLAAGVLLGLLARRPLLDSLWGGGPVPISLLHPRADELKQVLVALVLPQFALTFGNSIVATENTARFLFGEQARRVTARALSLSIGFMNLVGGMLMSAPTCHGSGGITAHYKFGARTQKSSYVIGATCLLLACFGRGALGMLDLIPTAILGVFLVYVGVQHGALIRDIVPRKQALLIALCVGLVSFAKTNLTYGFLAGFLLAGFVPGLEASGIRFRSDTRQRGRAKKVDRTPSLALTCQVMQSYRIALVPGDGIGREVVPAAVEVLQAAAHDYAVSFQEFDWGCDYYLRTGRMIAEDGLEQLKPFDAILLGAIGLGAIDSTRPESRRSRTTSPCGTSCSASASALTST